MFVLRKATSFTQTSLIDATPSELASQQTLSFQSPPHPPKKKHRFRWGISIYKATPSKNIIPQFGHYFFGEAWHWGVALWNFITPGFYPWVQFHFGFYLFSVHQIPCANQALRLVNQVCCKLTMFDKPVQKVQNVEIEMQQDLNPKIKPKMQLNSENKNPKWIWFQNYNSEWIWTQK